jgi:hypothetical protein
MTAAKHRQIALELWHQREREDYAAGGRCPTCVTQLGLHVTEGEALARACLAALPKRGLRQVRLISKVLAGWHV